MKRSAFATLCGVSKQMISKYAPHLVERDGEVDAAESLAALEGRLDEAKRQAALAALAGSAVLGKPEEAGDIAKSAKAQRDEVELELKRLDYSRQVGEVVSVEAVDDAARKAVASLRETFGQRKRGIAERICLAFDLAPEKATPLALLIGREFEGTLGVFADEMAQLASPASATPAQHGALATA